jgi:hypothetical protein
LQEMAELPKEGAFGMPGLFVFWVTLKTDE